MSIPNTFQTPNWVVDRAMGFLDNNELRVLIYAVRHIYGWQDKVDERQNRISITMFVNGFTTSEGTVFGGCGLSRPTVTKTLKSLVEMGFMAAVGAAGTKGQLWRITPDAVQWSVLEARQVIKTTANKRRMEKVVAAGEAAVNAVTGKSHEPVNTINQTGKSHEPASVNAINSNKPIAKPIPQTQQADAKNPAEQLGQKPSGMQNFEKWNEAPHPLVVGWINAQRDNIPKKIRGRDSYQHWNYEADSDQLEFCTDVGITAQDIAEYVGLERKRDFWRGKVVTLSYVLNNIVAWKRDKQVPIAAENDDDEDMKKFYAWRERELDGLS